MRRPWRVIAPAALLSAAVPGYDFMQTAEEALYSTGQLASARLETPAE